MAPPPRPRLPLPGRGGWGLADEVVDRGGQDLGNPAQRVHGALALAGLDRLGIASRATQVFEPDEMLRLRFRTVVLGEEANTERIDALYRAYGEAPEQRPS